MKHIEDMEHICRAEYVPWERLREKTILVTGATGLIGHTLVNALIYANHARQLNLKVIILTRDLERAKKRFHNQTDESMLEYVVGNVEALPTMDCSVDYIIHGASETASKVFVNHPVKTIMTALKGTENILELARMKKVSGMVYLSSMEVYGYPSEGHKVTEDEIGSLVPFDVRNSYPISKLQCENLCCAYAREYNVPAMSARLTQTFGPGVSYQDGRVFVEFARCALEKRDIVLKTRGETKRSYLYTADAVTALLTILLKGEPGQAYNVANESTYCSILEMARIVANQAGLNIRYEVDNEGKSGYLRVLFMNLDTSKLRGLGWNPGDYSICEMFQRMMATMKEA